ncbi:MAG: hypothetical protein ACP5US_10245 [Candidatus Kryptoniota bacterium]
MTYIIGEEGRKYFYQKYPAGRELVALDEEELMGFTRVAQVPTLIHVFFVPSKQVTTKKEIYYLFHIPPGMEHEVQKYVLQEKNRLIFEGQHRAYTQMYIIKEMEEKYGRDLLIWQFADDWEETFRSILF